jgi:hypothetical protein
MIAIALSGLLAPVRKLVATTRLHNAAAAYSDAAHNRSLKVVMTV